MIEIQDLGIVTGSEYNVIPYFTSGNNYFNWDGNACLNEKSGLSQAFNIKVSNKDYIRYQLFFPTGSEMGKDEYEKSNSDDIVTVIATANGTYTLKACDSTNNCATRDLNFNRNDCLAPIIAKTLSDTDSETYITDFFKDQDADAANNTSGIGQIYAFIHPYQNLQTYSEIPSFPDTDIYNSLYMIPAMSGYAIKKNTTTGSSSAINFDYRDYDYANSNTKLKDIVASAKKQNVLCGSYYIYFLVSDGTAPANVN